MYTGREAGLSITLTTLSIDKLIKTTYGVSHSILSHLYCELKLKMQTKVENSAKVTYGVKQAKVVEQAATSSLEPAAEPAIAEQAAVS